MSKNGTLITLILSLLVIGASIWVGSLLLQSQQDKGVLIATGPDLINKLPAPPMDEQGGTTIVLDGASLAPQTPLAEQEIGNSTANSALAASPAPDAPLTPPASTASGTKAPTAGNSSAGGQNYWVQAGSFSTLARATAAFDALQGLGLSGNIETVVQNERVLYRLRFGAWQNLAEAQRFRDYLRNQENLRNAFQERQMSDRSADFVDAFVVQ